MDRHDNRLIGRHLEVRGPRGMARGWVVGQIAQGMLIAVDKDLKDIRFVEDAHSYRQISKDRHHKLKLRITDATQAYLDETRAEISPQLDRAFSRLKHDCIFKFCRRYKKLHDEIDRKGFRFDHFGWNLGKSPTANLLYLLEAQVDKTVDLHREFYSAIEEAGFSDILEKFGPEFAKIPADLILPEFDLEFDRRDSLVSALEGSRENPWNITKHNKILGCAREVRDRLLFDAVSGVLELYKIRRDENMHF